MANTVPTEIESVLSQLTPFNPTSPYYIPQSYFNASGYFVAVWLTPLTAKLLTYKRGYGTNEWDT